MKKEFSVTAGVLRVVEHKLVQVVSDLLANYRRVSISYKPSEDTIHPYRVSYSQPIKLKKNTRLNNLEMK